MPQIGFKWFADGETPANNWIGTGGTKSITLDVLICDAKNPSYEPYYKDDGVSNYDGTACSYGRTRYRVTIQFGAKIYATNTATINAMIASPNIQIYDARRSWLGSSNTVTFVRAGSIIPTREENTYALEDVVLDLTGAVPL